MIIDLNKKRDQYFAQPTRKEIVARIAKGSGPFTLRTIQRLDEEDKVVVGTKDQSLDELLEGRGEVNSLDLVSKIDSLLGDKLLILPAHYHLASWDARLALVYSLDTLVHLESEEVKRKMLGSKPLPYGKLSASTKEKIPWDPEEVLSTAFNLLHQRVASEIEQVHLGYMWVGSDNHRRVVSLYRAIQGAELRAFQNYAYFKLSPAMLGKEIDECMRSDDRSALTSPQLERRIKKLARYDRYLRKQGISDKVMKLDVSASDLIEPDRSWFRYQTGREISAPSRAKPNQPYKFHLTSIPFVKHADQSKYSHVWNLRGTCYSRDKLYRSDRRDGGFDEDFFVAQEIAGYHTLQAMYRHTFGKRIEVCPFVIPTAAMMEYVEKLRHQTLVAVQNHSGRYSLEPLNNTSMENLIAKKVIAQGYNAAFTTRLERFKEQGEDPLAHLITFAA